MLRGTSDFSAHAHRRWLGHVSFWQILLQKSPRKEAGCALAPNTSLDLEGDYADDRQRDQRDL